MKSSSLLSLHNRVSSLGQPVPAPSPEEIATYKKPHKCRTQRCQRIFDLAAEGRKSYGGGAYCSRCSDRYLRKASDTGKYHYKDHLHLATGGRLIYKTAGFEVCAQCGLYTEDPKQLGTRILCPEHYAEAKRIKMKSAITNVLDYCAMQDPENDGLLLGVEWELDNFLDNRDESIDTIVSAIGEDFCIAKGDGSLDYGAEFVTAPAGATFLLERLKRGCEVIDTSVDIEDNEASRSGIHIHIARSFFPDEESIEKFISFINSRSNKRLIEKIANRYNCQWAYILGKSSGYKRGWYRSMESEGKYASVNVNHRNTLEVRLFHSTTKFATMAARVEFVAALARFSILPETEEAASIEAFFDYIRPRIETYPNLYRKIKSLDTNK